jgi:hypothetical protein
VILCTYKAKSYSIFIIGSTVEGPGIAAARELGPGIAPARDYGLLWFYY